MRSIHSLPGIFVALYISILAITGAYLSAEPVLDQFSVASSADLNVANVADMAARNVEGIERIERKASGEIVVHAFRNDSSQTVILDPASERISEAAPRSPVSIFVTELHRSLFMNGFGRGLVGFSALLLLVISYSGLSMLAKRMGGWSKLFCKSQGAFSQRLHVNIARFACIGLSLSAVTGLYLSLTTFGFIPDTSTSTLQFPSNVASGQTMPLAQMEALNSIQFSDLRELTFPYPDDPTDVFTIKTASGEGYIDQVTGQFISFQTDGLTTQIYNTIYLLHTGRGGLLAAITGLLLGTSALAIPILSLTGIVIWFRRYRKSPRISHNAAIDTADTVILVGSEAHTTWGFAATLHAEFVRLGNKVRIDEMNNITQAHLAKKRLFILTSTYGDGDAPESAKHFMDKLNRLDVGADTHFAVLGFGDKQFPNFCKFAEDVDAKLGSLEAKKICDLDKIDRQSPQAFRDWGMKIGQKMALDLVLEHIPQRPKTNKTPFLGLVAVSSEEEQTAILRFGRDNLPVNGRSSRQTFEAGDLIGIIPPGSDVPRFYSIASSSDDGFIEICVKRHKFGLCSNYLLDLQPGDHIDCFIEQNQNFKPAADNKPLIMIGAGTGIAPLAGFARQNTSLRPTYLFWGGRNPRTDFLYLDILVGLSREQKLSRAFLAFSRIVERQYVQDKVKAEAELLRTLMQQGAQILVCGGPEMAAGVRATIDEIFAPVGKTASQFKQQKRYLEDVY